MGVVTAASRGWAVVRHPRCIFNHNEPGYAPGFLSLTQQMFASPEACANGGFMRRRRWIFLHSPQEQPECCNESHNLHASLPVHCAECWPAANCHSCWILRVDQLKGGGVMGWLAIGIIAGTFCGVFVGVLVIGLSQMAREPRERGDLWAQLERDRTQQPGDAIHRQTVGDVEMRLKHRREN
jgi:hypothetical protein